MHHCSLMPCLDLGHRGEPWVICLCKYRALGFLFPVTHLTATFLGICQALSIAESSKRLGYPLSMSCFLISWSLWSLFSGSLQIIIILMLNHTFLHSFIPIFMNFYMVYHGVRKVYHGVRKVYHGVKKV